MRKFFLSQIIFIGLCVLLVFVLLSCVGGYGTKIGYQKKSIKHSGYSYVEIFNASLDALKEVGIVRSSDKKSGVIEGEIPPYTVKATCKVDSAWLKLEGMEEEHGAWKRDKSKGEWFISIDGRAYYRRGASTIKDALYMWSHNINKRIPAK